MSIHIKQAVRGRTYPAHLLPSSLGEDEVAWTRLGDDERLKVILHRHPRRIEVLECLWNDDAQDWEDHPVDPDSVDLTVYLP